MSIGAFRRRLLLVAALALFVMLVGVFVGLLPQPIVAAYAWLAVVAATAVALGCALAFVWVGSYRADRSDFSGSLAGFARYALRAGAWGIAGAGIGTLFVQALPARIVAAGNSDPSSVPFAGWFAIVGGGVGVGFGLLEEWHRSSASSSGDNGPGADTEPPGEPGGSES